MADPIETWRILQFKDSVQHLLQEQGGKLRSAVTYDGSYTGKGARPVVQMGETAAIKVTERYGDSPNIDVPTDARWLFPVDYEWGKLVDSRDKLRLGMQPDGEYTKAGVNAMRRAEDVEILAALLGSAKTGEQGGTTTAFLSTNAVGVAVGGANTGLNHAKLRAVRKLLQKNKVDLDAEQLFMAITEEDVASLFGESATTSLDFVEGRPVSTGKLPQLYGFNFIPFSSDTLNALGYYDGSHTYTLPAWVKSGAHLGTWQDMTVTVAPDPTKKFIPRIYMQQTLGATRLEEKKVVKVSVYY